MSEGEDLQLASVEAGSGRGAPTRYRHPLAHYAVAWGLGEKATRTLKRWIADGRKASPPELPPFDEPSRMAAWWRTHKTWRVPDWMAAIESPEPPDATENKPPPAPTGPVELALPKLNALQVNADATGDVGVRIFLALVNDTIRRINESAALGNHREYNRLQKELAGQLENLRKQEAAALKVQEGKGEILRARTLAGEVTAMFSVATQSFENAMIALVEQIAPQLQPAERRAKVGPFREACIRHLRNTRFASVWSDLTPAA